MDVGKTYQTPGSETKDFTIDGQQAAWVSGLHVEDPGRHYAHSGFML